MPTGRSAPRVVKESTILINTAVAVRVAQKLFTRYPQPRRHWQRPNMPILKPIYAISHLYGAAPSRVILNEKAPRSLRT
jgi:hypothetical protein